MWFYVIVGVVVVALAAVAYVFYRGYNKIKPKPIAGIPCPPLTHPILGHPDKMLHPLKHVLRLEVCESARSPVHQLVLMSHASIFINDAKEAARVINEVSEKGRIYTAFRYDANVPDILACDGEAHEIRSKALGPALQSLGMASDERITADLLGVLGKCGESGQALNFRQVSVLLGMDVVCEAAFGYHLGAVAGSQEGERLSASLQTMADVQAGQGVYPSPQARKVPPEELIAAKENWKAFLLKIAKYVQSEADVFQASHGELDVEGNYGHALVELSKTNAQYKEAIMMSEIHQVLRHGHECIGGMLQWLGYVIFRVKKLRGKLEKAILEHTATANDPYPIYLECVIKETLRRYPVAGNMTVRTPAEAGGNLAGGFEAPSCIPLHVPIFTLQNSTRDWFKPMEFLPERWMDEEGEAPLAVVDPSGRKVITRLEQPKCPFLAKLAGASASAGAYDGLGFEEDSLSFFPFSAGERSCPGKHLALQVMRRFVFDMASQYHLDPYETFWEEDPGVSANATIVPLHDKATQLKVRRIVSLGALVAQEKGALESTGGVAEADEGWAEEVEEDSGEKK
mmetsp:Transcript_1578/g.3255  ORF Transcript_1578/g.3255 Transcript_1578/m.3255 type:complete len:571 (-) Transcript_1578:2345-4057(-)